MLVFPLPEGEYRITQTWGQRPEVYKRFGMAGHNGIDIAPLKAGYENQAIFAPHEGYVRVLNDPEGYGKCVEITSLPYNTEGHQKHSVLGHFRDITVTDGKFVGAGDKLGIMGRTGFADGIHTHWTYKRKVNGKTIDYNNGFKGAVQLDLLRSIIYWNRKI